MTNIIKLIDDIFAMGFDIVIPVSGSIIAVAVALVIFLLRYLGYFRNKRRYERRTARQKRPSAARAVPAAKTPSAATAGSAILANAASAAPIKPGTPNEATASTTEKASDATAAVGAAAAVGAVSMDDTEKSAVTTAENDNDSMPQGARRSESVTNPGTSPQTKPVAERRQHSASLRAAERFDAGIQGLFLRALDNQDKPSDADGIKPLFDKALRARLYQRGEPTIGREAGRR